MAAVENLKNILRESDLPPDTVNDLLDGFENITDRSRKEKRVAFFINVISRMEDRLDLQKCRDMREQCACSQNIYRTGAIRKLANEMAHLPLVEKIEILNNNQKFGFSTTQSGNTLIFHNKSPKCSCKVFDGVSVQDPIPDSYCYCCAGYFKGMYETVLGVKLRTLKVKSSYLTSQHKIPCNIVYEIEHHA